MRAILLAVMLVPTARAADVPFYLRSLDDPRAVSAINENFRSIVNDMTQMRADVDALSGSGTSSGTAHYVLVSSVTCAFWPRQGTAVPADDTVPQISEGWTVLVATITPKNANSTIFVIGRVNATEDSNVGDYGVMTLFNSGNASPASAIQAANLWAGGDAGSTQGPAPGVLFHFESAGSTAQRYYSLNIGCNVSSCLGLNDRSAGRMYGGSECSDLTILELMP